VPFPVWAHEIVRFAVAPHHLQEIVLLAKNYEPEDALARGLIDEIVATEVLGTRAAEVARRLAAIPRPTFDLMKRLIRRPTVDRVHAYSAEHDPAVQQLWSSDVVRASIERFLERLKAR
jgi:enoyl-CoA hydratase/carnithine racemase